MKQKQGKIKELREIKIFSDNEICIPWIFWFFISIGITAILLSIAMKILK